MEGDFIAILPSLQKLRNVEINLVIKYANKIYQKFSKVNIEKLAKKTYESQLKDIRVLKQGEALEFKGQERFGQAKQ